MLATEQDIVEIVESLTEQKMWKKKPMFCWKLTGAWPSLLFWGAVFKSEPSPSILTWDLLLICPTPATYLADANDSQLDATPLLQPWLVSAGCRWCWSPLVTPFLLPHLGTEGLHPLLPSSPCKAARFSPQIYRRLHLYSQMEITVPKLFKTYLSRNPSCWTSAGKRTWGKVLYSQLAGRSTT